MGVVKALHLLAPGYFPLWDEKIANAYECNYSKDAVGKYLEFIVKAKIIAAALAPHVECGDRTILKLIDEYNYARFTKGWV